MNTSQKMRNVGKNNFMRKLALSDEILLKISQPARYIGGEVNMVKKDPSKVAVRFAMCFPDVYEIGMSHLGIQILYDMFNRRDDVYCERVYSPWMDLDPIMREQKIPLFAVESQDPIKKFDFLGITIQYEMCYTNILQVLELSQIPLHAEDRTEEDPIVIGGGPCTYNPEPIAPFFDLFYMGEGEVVYYDLIDRYKEIKARGGSRQEFLEMAAQIPGIYVPAFYDVSYKADGTIEAMIPNNPHAPQTVSKQLVMDMSDTWYPEKPVVPYLRATQDRVVLEIMRGCIRGCRFCQAGMVYRPVRERSLEELKRLARTMLKSTGHEEISLSSLSSSDYTKLEGIVNFLIDEFDGKGVNVSLPSLRIDAFSLDVMSKVQDVKKSSLTFAPEAGSQRLRNVINKGLTEENILNGSAEAFKGGWNRVKLYFMLGLPTETDEDVLGIADIAAHVMHAWRESALNKTRGVRITVSTSWFVPKPHTAFQWEPQIPIEEYERRVKLLREAMNTKSVTYNWHPSPTSFMEAVISCGDRRLGKVIETAWRKGETLSAWEDYFDLNRWMEAFEECGLDPHFYANRRRSEDEILPWSMISCGVAPGYLKREHALSYEGVTTPDCRTHCNACGANCLVGGKCDV